MTFTDLTYALIGKDRQHKYCYVCIINFVMYSIATFAFSGSAPSQ